MHNPAGLKEDKKSPLKLTLKGPESPTCAAAAEGPAGPDPGFRRGLHSPPRSPGPRQSQEPLLGSRSGNPRAPCAPGPLPPDPQARSVQGPQGLGLALGGPPTRLPPLLGRRASPTCLELRAPPPLAQHASPSSARASALGLVPLPPDPSLTTSPSFSHHVRTSGPLWKHSSPTPRRGLGAGVLAGGRLVATRVPSVRSGRCARPGPGSPALPALNEPLARSIVAPQGSIRQNWTTMWRLPLARGDSRRSDWPGPRPGSPSFYCVRKIRNSARSAECLRDGRGRQGRSERGGALQMS